MRSKSPFLWTSLTLIALTSCGTFQMVKRQYRSGYYLSIKNGNQPIHIADANRSLNSFNSDVKYEPTPIILSGHVQPNFKNDKLHSLGINKLPLPITKYAIFEKKTVQPAPLAHGSNFYKGDDTKEGDEKKNWAAVTGFICAFFFPVLGIIFSAIGLKSQKHGLAVAGLVLSIIFTVLLIMLL